MKAAGAAGLAAVLLAAGLVASRPLPARLDTTLPVSSRAPVERRDLVRAPGDTLQLYYQLWLFRDGLVGPTPLLRDPYQFRVDGPRWNLPQTFPPLALPFTALAVFGPHAAYNLLVLLSFPLAGLAAYALARHHTGHTLAAAAAGAAFALAPARLGPLFGGQPAGFAAALAPLVLWGLDVALTQGRLRGGLVGGGALFGLATLEPHYAYLVGGLLPLHVALRLTRAAPRRRLWAPLGAFAILGAAGAGWLWMLRQAFLVGSIADRGRSLAEVALFSSGPRALLEPETYGGVVVLALALAGLAAGPAAARPLRLFYGGLLAGGVVLALGPTLPGVPLYQTLHRFLPLFGLIRNPAKLALLASLGGAVLTAFGVVALARRLPRALARPGAAAAVAAVVLGTMPWHPIAVTRFPSSAVHEALRRDGGRVLYLPLWPGDSALSSVYLHDVTRTRAPMLNGYSPLAPRRYVAEVFRPLEGLNTGDLGPAEHALLHRLGVTHVALDRSVFPPQVSPFPSSLTRDRLRASPGLALEAGVDPLWLFRVTARPPGDAVPATSPAGVFYEAEQLARETGDLVGDRDASGGRVVAARPGAARPGFLVFGPYRPLPAGRYRATFRVRGGGLALDVAAEQGRRILGQRGVDAGAAWQDVTLHFALDRAAPVEFRVRWDGVGDAAADWVSVVFADRPEPEWTFEVEALPHKLGERPDPAASGGWAGYADPGESLHTDLVTGPARLYPAGRYRLTLRARAEGAVEGPLLRLAVSEPAGRVLAQRTVDARELAPGAYRDVSLDWELERPAVVEFPTGYLGKTGVFFDRLAVSLR